MSTTPRDAHLNNFDVVRVVAALFVVVSHQFALTGLPEPTFLNVHTLGGLGVLVFFSVSGYLVAQSWQADPHVLRFAARRAADLAGAGRGDPGVDVRLGPAGERARLA